MTTTLDNDLLELQQLLPSDRWQGSASALAAFQSDGLTAFAVQPRAIVTPRTVEEVVEAVRWCHKRHVPFVARGSGTSCLLYTSPSPRDRTRSRMPSSA